MSNEFDENLSLAIKYLAEVDESKKHAYFFKFQFDKLNGLN